LGTLYWPVQMCLVQTQPLQFVLVDLLPRLVLAVKLVAAGSCGRGRAAGRLGQLVGRRGEGRPAGMARGEPERGGQRRRLGERAAGGEGAATGGEGAATGGGGGAVMRRRQLQCARAWKLGFLARSLMEIRGNEGNSRTRAQPKPKSTSARALFATLVSAHLCP
jgi:hypothetical protein